MAWTSPRTWVTAETVTAALLNTHLRDNMLQTAPAKVTTAGDIVYASAANTLVRLGIGSNGQFLRGGPSSPLWSSAILGDMSVGTVADNANLRITDIIGDRGQLRVRHPSQTDVNDEWGVAVGSGDTYALRWWDDSASASFTSLSLDPKDFVLHTGTNAGAGAVVIETDSLSSTALTTGGTGALAVTITTGGAAYVIGWFSILLTRSAAGSAGNALVIVPHDDGASIGAAFNLGTGNDWADAMIPTNADTGTYSGFFYKRFTSSNTSTWSVNLSASVNSVFTATASRLIVISVQYPT